MLMALIRRALKLRITTLSTQNLRIGCFQGFRKKKKESIWYLQKRKYRVIVTHWFIQPTFWHPLWQPIENICKNWQIYMHIYYSMFTVWPKNTVKPPQEWSSWLNYSTIYYRRWWTGRPGVLRYMGSRRVRHDWATELNWTEYAALKIGLIIYVSKTGMLSIIYY